MITIGNRRHCNCYYHYIIFLVNEYILIFINVPVSFISWGLTDSQASLVEAL